MAVRSPARLALRLGAVSSAMIRPWSITSTRSPGVGLLQVVRGQHEGCALLSAQLQNVIPRLARFCGSMPVDGSSRNSSLGRCISPRPDRAGGAGRRKRADAALGRGRTRSRLASSSSARPAASSGVHPVEAALVDQLITDPEAVAGTGGLTDATDPGTYQRRLGGD